MNEATTDLEELRKAAEAASEGDWYVDKNGHHVRTPNNPQTILALIGEIERLRAALTECATNRVNGSADYSDLVPLSDIGKEMARIRDLASAALATEPKEG